MSNNSFSSKKEISIVRLSEIQTYDKLRFDSEFYLNRFVNAYCKIISKPYTYLGEELDLLTDFHANGSYKKIAENFKLLDEPDFAYMVRTVDLKSKNYSENVKYVSKNTYDFLAKSKVFGGEIIINKIGSPGETFLMPKLNKPVSLGMNNFLLNLKGTSKLTNVYVYLFLNTEIGKNIIQRNVSGTIPKSIDKDSIRNIPVPVFSNKLYDNLEKILLDSDNAEKDSNSIYKQANDILLQQSRLESLKKSSFSNFVKRSLREVINFNRIDAEYYQPKYEFLIQKIKENNFDNLANLVNIQKSIEPGSEFYKDEGIPFIRVADVDKFGIEEPKVYLSPEYFSEVMSPKKDTILFSKDGTCGIAYKLEENRNFITSSALLHLTKKDNIKVDLDYLTLVLNSPIIQMQADRDAGGSIIKHWSVSQIEQVLVPLLDESVQNSLGDMVRKSFALRRRSQELLRKAQLAIEIAIEDNEEAALAFLEKSL